MTTITFEDFQKELTELFMSSVNGGHPDYCKPRFYEDLPHNMAHKYYKKKFRPLWWFIFDFNEIYTGIITYEPKCNNFNLYLECRGLKRDGEPQCGWTVKVAVACSIVSAWTTLGLHILMVYWGTFWPDRNDVWYAEDTANENFLNGDSPFDVSYKELSFTRGLELLFEARKHPEREWKGQRIGLTLSGMFANCEYITEIR